MNRLFRNITVIFISASFPILAYFLYFSDVFTINRIIEESRAAFENEDISGCMAVISEDYSDSLGHRSKDIEKIILDLFETQANIKTLILSKKKDFLPSDLSPKKKACILDIWVIIESDDTEFGYMKGQERFIAYMEKKSGKWEVFRLERHEDEL